MKKSSESVVIVRYAPGEALEWPWSITHENGRPVLTITDLDDSSLGIVLRAVAQAEGKTAGWRSDPQPDGVRVCA